VRKVQPVQPSPVVRQLLYGPSVAVGIGERHERSPGEHINLAYLNSASGQLCSGLVNVAHDDLEVVQRTRRQLSQPLADGNRACGAGWGQLHKADVISHRVVVVEDETGLVYVEILGAIHIADRHTYEFESESHVSDGIRRLRQFEALFDGWVDGGRSQETAQLDTVAGTAEAAVQA